MFGKRCSGVRVIREFAKMRAATEISAVSTLMPAGAVKVRMIGRKARVASSGASSVKACR